MSGEIVAETHALISQSGTTCSRSASGKCGVLQHRNPVIWACEGDESQLLRIMFHSGFGTLSRALDNVRILNKPGLADAGRADRPNRQLTFRSGGGCGSASRAAAEGSPYRAPHLFRTMKRVGATTARASGL
jgi:hypothetical protein